jgi:cyclopropane fatty-acyl-phospholipid synthase-like methyltransferase
MTFNTPVYADFIMRDRTRHAHYEALEHELGLPPDATVSLVDAGCGSGDLIRFLKRHFRHVSMTGFDHSPELVRLAQQRAAGQQDVEFHIADAAEFNAAKGFDLATSTMMLPYVDTQEKLNEVFRNMSSLVRTRFLSVVFNPDFEPTDEKVVANRRFERVGTNQIRVNFLSPGSDPASPPALSELATQWSWKEYERAAEAAGFAWRNWTPILLDPDSNPLVSQGHVADARRQPYVIFDVGKNDEGMRLRLP